MILNSGKSRAPELPNGVIGVVDCLAALLPQDADADVSALDHGDVVGAVADRQHLALQRDAELFVI